MPLPLIPIALGLASAVSAVFGAKKGLNAKKELERAQSALDDAVQSFDAAKDRVETQKNQTNTGLQKLGKLRLVTDAGPIKNFINVASFVHEVERNSTLQKGQLSVRTELPTFDAMRISAYRAADLLKDGVASVPVGVLTGIGAAGTVSALGAASTGTAISTLTGVAASNATLAWLGGGSLAAGGWGVAGGTAVLGGVALGPVIAVMGLAAASKMNKQATAVREKEAEYQVAIEQLENAITVLQAVDARVAELSSTITEITGRFKPVLKKLTSMIDTKRAERARLEAEVEQRRQEAKKRSIWVRLWRFITGKWDNYTIVDPLKFAHFTKAEKDQYMLASVFASQLSALVKVQVLDEEGALSDRATECIANGQAFLLKAA